MQFVHVYIQIPMFHEKFYKTLYMNKFGFFFQ